MSQSWKFIFLGAGVGLICFSCSTTPTATDADLDQRSPFITVFPKQPSPTLAVQTNVPPPAPPTPANPPPNVVTHEPPPPARVPSPPPNRPRRSTWVNTDAWDESNGWSKPQRLRSSSTFTYELHGGAGVMQVTAGLRTALWNGVNLELGFAPRLTNAQAQIHSLDITKTFEPLNAHPAFLAHTNRVIVLDPGHGGDNYGAKSAAADRFEKDYALDWARRVEKLLSNRGWRVYLTRTNDVDVTLSNRVAFADQVQADLFLSLHFNSTDQPQGRAEQGGVETYCVTPVGMPSSLTRHFEDELDHPFPNNAFDAENYWLATRIHAALVHSTRRRDRGVRRARFMGVIRSQNRPAVLVEGGYLTWAPEARLIAQPEYRQSLAEAVVKGLSDCSAQELLR